jgi:hypothetical protein
MASADVAAVKAKAAKTINLIDGTRRIVDGKLVTKALGYVMEIVEGRWVARVGNTE